MKILRQHFCVTKSMSKGDPKELVAMKIEAPLDARTLGFQTSMFKLTMKSNAKVAMEEPKNKNLVTKLWEKKGLNALMLNHLSRFIKIAEIAISIVHGSVEDKRTFSTLGFKKSKLRNHLGRHLDICVKVFLQPFFFQEIIPYRDAICFWLDECTRLGSGQ
jgi:hypothetical protein